MSGYCAFAEMDKNELQAISRRGGVASGKVRREKRRRVEQQKFDNLVQMGVILDGIHILKQMYRAMPPEEKEELHSYLRGSG